MVTPSSAPADRLITSITIAINLSKRIIVSGSKKIGRYSAPGKFARKDSAHKDTRG
jgi:hypothetical protein